MSRRQQIFILEVFEKKSTRQIRTTSFLSYLQFQKPIILEDEIVYLLAIISNYVFKHHLSN